MNDRPELILIGAGIVLFVAWTTGKAWEIWWRYRPYKLPLVLAIGNTIAGVTALFWMSLAAYRQQVGPLPPPMIVLSSVVALALLFVPSLNTWYLLFISRKRNGGGERREDHPHE